MNCPFCKTQANASGYPGCATFQYFNARRGRQRLGLQNGQWVRSIVCYEREIANLKAQLASQERGKDAGR